MQKKLPKRIASTGANQGALLYLGGLVGACLVAIMHTSESPLAAVVPIPMFGRTEKVFFFCPRGFGNKVT